MIEKAVSTVKTYKKSDYRVDIDVIPLYQRV